jgi:hypothetical protein
MSEFESREQSQEEINFLKELESLKTLPLTQYEALFLSDSVTLLLEHEPERKTLQIPARGIQASASVPVPLEMITRLGLAVLLATDPNNNSKMADLVVTVSELYLLRECCQSYVTHGNEPVGYNLIRKIYKLLLENELKEREIFDNLLSDISVNLENRPKIERLEEPKDADTRTNNDRRSD